jgi:hypothetical protein
MQSVHHTLFSHFGGRTPLMATYGAAEGTPLQQAWDVRNNVFYDCKAGGGYFHNDNMIPINLVGNYYKSGLSTAYPINPAGWQPNKGCCGTPIYSNYNTIVDIPVLTYDKNQDQYFAKGNANDPAMVYSNDSFPIPPTSTTLPQQAYEDVMAGAGAWPRDSADRQYINEVINKLGHFATFDDYNNRVLDVPTESKPQDSDGDGMANAWETANGLNPNSGSDYGTKMNGGYDAIEVYINELSDLYAPCSAGFAAIDRDKEGIEDFWGMRGIKVSPNPFRPSTRITYSIYHDEFKGKAIQLSIFDMTGRLVQQKKLNQLPGRMYAYSWNASGKAAGVYVVRLKTPFGTVSRKVLLAK